MRNVFKYLLNIFWYSLLHIITLWLMLLSYFFGLAIFFIPFSGFINTKILEHLSYFLTGTIYGLCINFINARLISVNSNACKIKSFHFLYPVGGIVSIIISFGLLWPHHHLYKYYESIRISLSFGLINGFAHYLVLNKFFKHAYLYLFVFTFQYWLIGDALFSLWYSNYTFVDVFILTFISSMFLSSTIIFISKFKRKIIA